MRHRSSRLLSRVFGLGALALLPVAACQHSNDRVVEPANGGGSSSRSPALDTDAAVLGPLALDNQQPKNDGDKVPAFGLPAGDRIASRAEPSQIGPAGGVSGIGGQGPIGGGRPAGGMPGNLH